MKRVGDADFGIRHANHHAREPSLPHRIPRQMEVAIFFTTASISLPPWFDPHGAV
jgi:hypothetical protein